MTVTRKKLIDFLAAREKLLDSLEEVLSHVSTYKSAVSNPEIRMGIWFDCHKNLEAKVKETAAELEELKAFNSSPFAIEEALREEQHDTPT